MVVTYLNQHHIIQHHGDENVKVPSVIVYSKNSNKCGISITLFSTSGNEINIDGLIINDVIINDYNVILKAKSVYEIVGDVENIGNNFSNVKINYKVKDKDEINQITIINN